MSGRDRRVDVAKGVLIVLVVVGHFLVGSMGRSTVGYGTGWSEEPQRFLLTGIYLAHMPLFAFFVGLTARSDRLVQRIAKLVVLGVTLHLGYVVSLRVLTGEWPTNALLAPYWVLWFIAAMVWWLIALPLVERAPRAALVGSIVAVALVGLAPIEGYVAAFSRAVVFFPFFVIGHVYGWRLLDLVGRIRVPTRLVAAAALLALTTYVWTLDIDRQWIFGSQTFDQLGVETPVGVLGRLGLLAATLTAASCLLSLIPQRSAIFELPGRHSLAIFVLHPIPLLIYRRIPEPFGPDSFSAQTQVGIAIVLSGLVVAFFALPVFDRVLRRYSDRTVDGLMAVTR